MQGISPALVGSNMDGNSERGLFRMTLRTGFGNSGWLSSYIPSGQVRNSITPFRVAMNAGDIQGSVNSSPMPQLPSADQTHTVGHGKLNVNAGGVHNNGTSAYTGNPKFVYDGSDYVRYRKLAAMNRNYNDSSFGGDQSNATYTFLNRVRR
jgi:hypothetical protein